MANKITHVFDTEAQAGAFATGVSASKNSNFRVLTIDASLGDSGDPNVVVVYDFYADPAEAPVTIDHRCPVSLYGYPDGSVGLEKNEGAVELDDLPEDSDWKTATIYRVRHMREAIVSMRILEHQAGDGEDGYIVHRLESGDWCLGVLNKDGGGEINWIDLTGPQ